MVSNAPSKTGRDGVPAGPGDVAGRPLWAGLRRLAPGSTLVLHLILAVLGGVVIYLISISIGPFREVQLASVGYYIIAVGGLTLLVGLNGQISLGHGAFMAVGAYTTALLQTDAGWPLWAGLIASVGVAAVTGGIVGAAAARLRGPYLAGATLAFAVGLPALAIKFSGFLKAYSGIVVGSPTPPGSVGFEQYQAWICWLAALITLVLLANLVRSRVGRNFRAVRDDEVAAELAGVHVARTQILAFVVSAACAGLAGGLLAMVIGSAGPGSFTLTLSISLLAGVVVGGLGSLTGALWGSLMLVYFPTWAQDVANTFSLSTDVQANLPIAAFGVLLMLVMLVFPGGIQGALRLAGGLGLRLLPRTKPLPPTSPAAPAGGSSVADSSRSDPADGSGSSR